MGKLTEEGRTTQTGMSVQSDTISTVPKSPRPKSKKRSVWKWIGITLLCLGVVLAVISAWMWSHRYSILERYVVTLLQEQGIEAELSIESASSEAAVLKNIKLTYQSDEDPFFSAKRIEAEYLWKEEM